MAKFLHQFVLIPILIIEMHFLFHAEALDKIW